MTGQPGTLTTRPLVWDAALQHLFVNVVIQPAGFFQAAVLDAAGDGQVLAGLSLANSTVGGIGAGRCVGDEAEPFDSTRARVQWEGGAQIGAVSGKTVRLQFRFAAASLYSFWLAPSACGASGGYLGGGGPGSVGGRDIKGGC